MPKTEISYLVIDEDPMSPDFETVFEVLGTELDQKGPLTSRVWLRNCRTDRIVRMWVNTFATLREFRALPLDQVSQDRKDARDRFDTQITDPRTGEIWNTAGTAYAEDGKTAIGVWVEDGIESDHVIKLLGPTELFRLNNLVAYPRTPEPLQPAPGVEFRPMDTAAKAQQYADRRADVQDRIAEMDTEFAKLRTLEEVRNSVRLTNNPQTYVPVSTEISYLVSAARWDPSTEHQLGRALYLIRALLNEVDEDSEATIRAHSFLAELDPMPEGLIETSQALVRQWLAGRPAHGPVVADPNESRL